MLVVGATVKVSAYGHRRDGQEGTVTYKGEFFGTWGVDFHDGCGDYGFLPSELEVVTKNS